MNQENRKYGNRFKLFMTAASLFFLVFASGCVSATAGITTSNIPLEGKKYTVLGTAETTEQWFSIDLLFLGFPLEPPPVDQAMKTLMVKKGGNALINLRYSTDKIVIFLGFTIHRFHLKADVVKVEADSSSSSRRKGRR